MHNDQEVFYRLALSLVDGIGPRISRSLISHLGSASRVFRTPHKELMRVTDMGSIRAERIRKFSDFKRAEEEFEFALKHGVTLHTYTDQSYPKRLKECVDGPLVLFTKGNGLVDQERVVAIVGTRYATDYGLGITEDIVRGLETFDAVTVSGLAYGIDICAHKMSLKYDVPTFCVLAHGLDRVYPATHSNVADQMLERGGWVTEHLSKTIPDRDNFPKRNRIIAGLSDAVIVVEAARKGGALITAGFANEYNRDVFAVPGDLKNTFSEGCNRLIRSHQAALYSEIGDLSYIMGWESRSGSPALNKQSRLFLAENETERLIHECLEASDGPVELHDLLEATSLTIDRLLPTLLQLQLREMVREMPGKRYRVY